MSDRELDAAGITDPVLRASYETCRRLNAEHGKTYYLATLLLPAEKRPFVHALYGFARYADELVDSFDSADPEALVSWSESFLSDLTRGHSDDPVGLAMLDTMRRWDIPHDYAEAFLRSMRMDLHISGYETYDELRDYMWGSAAVIGLEMLPILGVLPGGEKDAEYGAAALGEAFQMSNFLRDVGEDVRRGRVYLPAEDLRRFGLTREDLATGVVTEPFRELMRFEITRTRAIYADAHAGVDALEPTSRDCIRTALVLYGGILDAIERADYQVLRRRVRVSVPRRLQVAVPGAVRAWRARREAHSWHELVGS